MLQIPDGAGTRFDGAIRQGQEITPYYDPMLGKLICWGPDRETALNRSERALREFYVGGIETTIQFCRAVIAHPDFREGPYDTHFYALHKEELHEQLATPEPELLLVGGSTAYYHLEKTKKGFHNSAGLRQNKSNWVSSGLRNNQR